MDPYKLFAAEFLNRINGQVKDVITSTPVPKAKIVEKMGLNATEALLFTAMIEADMYPQIKSQRGRNGGMFIPEAS